MRVYLASGRDIWADGGRFEILVQADDRADAKKIVAEHLALKNQSELKFELKNLPLREEILYSNVENRII